MITLVFPFSCGTSNNALCSVLCCHFMTKAPLEASYMSLAWILSSRRDRTAVIAALSFLRHLPQDWFHCWPSFGFNKMQKPLKYCWLGTGIDFSTNSSFLKCFWAHFHVSCEGRRIFPQGKLWLRRLFSNSIRRRPFCSPPSADKAGFVSPFDLTLSKTFGKFMNIWPFKSIVAIVNGEW